MKLSQFQPAVSPNTIEGRVTAPGNEESYGKDVHGTEVMNNALAQVRDFADTLWVKNQNNRVIDATNDYQRRISSLMNDENEGLYVTNQGDNAERIQDLYTEQEQKIRADVMKQYGISSEYANKAFMKGIEPNVTAQLSNIDRYQRVELDKAANTRIANTMDTAVNAILENPEHMDEYFNNWRTNTMALRAARGMDEESMQKALHDDANMLAKRVLSTMQITSDYQRGKDVCAELRAYGVDEDIIKPFEKEFTSQEIIQTTGEDMESWVTQNEDKFDLLNDDPDKIADLYEKEHPITVTDPSKASIHTIREAVSGQESAGHYNAPKNKDGCWGRYQIKDSTWAIYAPKAGVALNDHSPAAQDKVAEYMMNEYLQKGGIDYLIIAWYGGEQNAIKWMNDPDKTHSSAYWTRKQRSKKDGKLYPSFKEYITSVKAKITGGNLSPEEQKAQQAQVRAQEVAKIKELQSKTKKAVATEFDTIQQNVEEKLASGTMNPQEAYRYAQGLINNGSRYVKELSEAKNFLIGLQSKATSFGNQQKQMDNLNRGLTKEGFCGKESFQVLESKLFNGEQDGIYSSNDLQNAINRFAEAGMPLSGDQIKKLNKDLGNALDGKGAFAYKIDKNFVANALGIKPSKVNDVTFRLAREAVAEAANETNGGPLTQATMRKVIYQKVGPQITGSYQQYDGLFGSSINGTNITVSLNAADMENMGIVKASKAPDGNWYVKMKDGQTKYVTLAQLHAAQKGTGVI